MRNILFIVSLMALSGCQKTDVLEQVKIKEKIVPTQVLIQPFSDMNAADTDYIFKHIKAIYPHVSVLETTDLPKEAFYPARNRYRADTIIKKLSQQTKKGFVTLGLTNKDISVTKGKVADFGVMGLGYRPGKSCVASSFRVKKDRKNEQHFKVAIHEIGHTQGLPHCPDKTCFMRDAEGGNPTDQLTDFCNKCKAFLETKHWKFK